MVLDITWYSTPNKTNDGRANSTEPFFVEMTTEEDIEAFSAHCTVQQPNPISVHFSIGRSGRVRQHLGLRDAAWAYPGLGDGAIAIMHTGWKDGDEITDAQYQATLQLHRYIMEERLPLKGLAPIPTNALIGYDDAPWFPFARLMLDLWPPAEAPDAPSDGDTGTSSVDAAEGEGAASEGGEGETTPPPPVPTEEEV